MKKLLNILIGIITIFFVASALYVFEIFPFNPGGPLIAQKEETQQTVEEELPDFLKKGVNRAKTYDEHMNRGHLLAQNGYKALAITEFKAAAEITPTNPDPLIEIGKLYQETEDLINAKLTFQKALTIDPSKIEASIALGKVHINERDINEAKSIFDAITIHNQTSKYYQGLVTIFTGDHEKGKTLLRQTINVGGDATITANSQNFLKAYAEFDANQGGSKLHLLTLLARSYNQTQEYQMAIPLLFEVIKEKKNYRDAWILLGYSYLNTNKYQDAIEALKEARKLDPEKPETSFYLGLGYFELGDLQQAVGYLETAKNNNYEPKIQVEQKLAEVYLQMQEYEKSLTSYETVLRLNNQEINYFIKPIWIAIDRLNQPERAVKLAQNALAAHPKTAMGHNLMGWTKIYAGQLHEAKRHLDKAASLDQNLDAIYLNYGKLYEERGDHRTAIAFYRKAYEMGKGSSISIAAANNYNKLIGNSDQVEYPELKANLLQQ